MSMTQQPEQKTKEQSTAATTTMGLQRSEIILHPESGFSEREAELNILFCLYSCVFIIHVTVLFFFKIKGDGINILKEYFLNLLHIHALSYFMYLISDCLGYMRFAHKNHRVCAQLFVTFAHII